MTFTEAFPIFASGAGLLAVFCGGVWFVVRLSISPVKERLAEEIKTREAAAAATASATTTAAAIGQKVHDMANQNTAHYAHDDQRFDEIKASVEARAAKTDAAIAELRRENLDGFAEIRKAIATKRR